MYPAEVSHDGLEKNSAHSGHQYARALCELRAPATCLIPRTWGDIIRTDRLLSTIEAHGFAVWMIFGVGGMIAFFTDIVVGIGTLEGGISLAVGLPVCGALSAFLAPAMMI